MIEWITWLLIEGNEKRWELWRGRIIIGHLNDGVLCKVMDTEEGDQLRRAGVDNNNNKDKGKSTANEREKREKSRRR